MRLEFDRISDDLISFRCPSSQHRTAFSNALRDTKLICEVVEGIECLVVQFDPLLMTYEQVIFRIESLSNNPIEIDENNPDIVTIPVEYNETSGPDLNSVCEKLGLTQQQFIKAHTSKIYPVDLIGFTPGFAYIGGTDFVLPRLTEPRLRVPAGSVGLAGGYTGLYALDGPGGWPIIGKTLKPLFLPDDKNPFVLKAGIFVKFEAV